MAAHSSVLAGRIPGMGEPGGLPSMGRRVGHDWSDLAAATWCTIILIFWGIPFANISLRILPTPVFLPGEPQGRGSLMGCRLWGCTDQIWLKWLSSRSIENFSICVLRDDSLSFCFIVMSLSGFVIRVILLSWVVKYSLCFYLLKEIVENWHNLFLKCLVKFTRNPSGPDVFFFGRLLINDSISLIDVGLFRGSISSFVNFGSWSLSRNWSISSRLSNLWTELSRLSPDFPSIIHGICSDANTSISDISNLCPLPFCLVSLAKGVSMLFDFFPENYILVLLIFSVYLFFSFVDFHSKS